MQKYSIGNYDYCLPKELIRQEPPSSREDSRLMHIEGNNISDRNFPDILSILAKGDLLILNRTRVRKALIYGKKITGGILKITVLERKDEGFVSLIAGKVRDNDIITVGDRKVRVNVREDGKRILTGDIDWDYLENVGHLPLPPYIKRRQDFSYYQNEIGNEIGSIAAPTASLHFSNDLLNKIKAKGVRVSFALLTVGYGTFK
ncbi:MAG: S-adenosylmethionine:tRNA ribosyltransferase-isomerase, partial [Thermoplasmata archaeon]